MAQVDTSIYGNMLRPVKSVQEYDAEAQQAEGNKLGLLLQRGQYDAQQRGVAQENALSGVYKNALNPDGTVDRSKIYSGAAGAGLGDRIPDLQKKFADADKVQEDTKLARSHAANFDSQVKEREFNLKQAQTLQHLQQVSGINSVQDAHAWIDAAEAAGELPPGRAPQVKQALATGQLDLNQWKSGVQNGGLTLMQQRDNEFKAAAQAETERDNKSKGVIAARNASAAEGQLSVARQRLTIDQQAPKGHYDSERGTVTDLRTGVAQPVTMGGKPLGPKDKAGTVTEGERNAGGYLLRMTEATKLLDKFEKTGTASYGSELAGAVPFVGGMTRRAVMSDDQQQYRQAQEDWVRAKLRKESGASIPPDEMDREIEAYFPMPGEGERVRAQKRQSRAVANTAMQQSAGRAAAQQNGGASGELGGGWSITPVGQ